MFKEVICIRTSLCVAVCVVLLSSFFSYADVTSNTGSGISGRVIWGDPTNQIKGGVVINYMPDPWIDVFASRQSGLNFGSNFTNLQKLMLRPIYMTATNEICCPFELRNFNDGKTNIIRPEPMYSSDYPDTLSFSGVLATWNEQRPKINFSLPPIPGIRSVDFLLITNQAYRIVYFNLDNYVKIRQGGQYQLIVWPKIYEQSETNKDIYKRIDLPPVTTQVKWSRG